MTSAPARPNVVLLVIDALRADAIEPLGAPAGASPAITRLAERGLAVEGVRSTASWTLPSHIGLFSGQLGRGLGLGQAPQQTPQSAAPVVRAQRERLLAEVLRQAGYATWGVTTNVWAGKASGFDTGFEQFAELDTSRHAQLGGGLPQQLRWGLEAVRARGDDGARQAESVINTWLGSEERRPFFLFVNLVECHSPYLPPRPHTGGGPLMRMRAAADAQRYLTFDAIMRTCLGAQTVPEAVLARMRRLYAASVRYADDWLARLVEVLRVQGQLDETLFIVCSDHGENLGEGGLLTHGLSLDDRLLRVPFVTAGPGAQAFAGMVSLAQLASRIAEAVDLPSHPWGPGVVNGLAVAQWDGYRLSESALAQYADSLGLGPNQTARLITPLTCAVSGHFKLVQGIDESQEWLYDLIADPLEVAPLREEGAMAARAGQALYAMRAAIGDPAVQAGAEVSAPPDAIPAGDAAEIERKMRLLGYM